MSCKRKIQGLEYVLVKSVNGPDDLLTDSKVQFSTSFS